MKNKNTAASAILNYLEERGITQTFLSKKTGIGLSKLNLALRGKRRLTIPEYEAVCYVLDLPVETFLVARPLDHGEK